MASLYPEKSKRLILARIYVLSVAVVSVATLAYVYIKPLPSMLVTRDGVAHLSPPVINPETGDYVDLGILVRHYQGD